MAALSPDVSSTNGDRAPSATLHVANLGDSGLRLFSRWSTDDDAATAATKPYRMRFATHEQQHEFNFPFQLGAESTDRVADAVETDLEVHDGDIVLLGSDGLYDNVWNEDLLRLVLEFALVRSLPIDIAVHWLCVSCVNVHCTCPASVCDRLMTRLLFATDETGMGQLNCFL